MPEKETVERARRAKREGKSPSTQAGEFVREEIHHIRQGRHGARSAKQAIAIGLSKARRAGVNVPPPPPGKADEDTRKKARRDNERGRRAPSRRPASTTRSRAAKGALEKEGTAAASHTALSRQARSAARKRTPAERSASARKGARTRAANRAAAREW